MTQPSTSNLGHMPQGFHTIRTSLQERMDAYDKLPKAVRQALQEVEGNWAAVNVKQAMRKRRWKSARMAEFIRQKGKDLYHQTMLEAIRAG